MARAEVAAAPPVALANPAPAPLPETRPARFFRVPALATPARGGSAERGAAAVQNPPTRRPNATLTPYDAATAAAAAAADTPVEHYGPAAGQSPPPGATAPVPAHVAPNAAAAISVNDLPAAARAQLPKLVPGGAIYSESASARMLILNGQVYHEGDKPAADTVLEQIRHRSAVLNFRGQRYEIAF